jgi:hypothetical protein
VPHSGPELTTSTQLDTHICYLELTASSPGHTQELHIGSLAPFFTHKCEFMQMSHRQRAKIPIYLHKPKTFELRGFKLLGSCKITHDRVEPTECLDPWQYKAALLENRPLSEASSSKSGDQNYI